MHVPARDEEDVARPDTHRFAIERPGGNTSQPIDRFVEGVVAMRYRHPGTRWDEEFEHRHASCGLRRLQTKPNLDLTRPDHLVSRSRIHHCPGLQTANR